MPYAVTLIPGDGIGPEVTEATRRVVDATGGQIDWHVRQAGGDIIARYGTPMPQATLDSIIENKVARKGPVTTPVGTGFRPVNVELRQKLDLYATYRPARTTPGVK